MNSRCASTVRLTMIATAGSCHLPGTTPHPLSHTNSLLRGRTRRRSELLCRPEGVDAVLVLAVGLALGRDRRGHCQRAGSGRGADGGPWAWPGDRMVAGVLGQEVGDGRTDGAAADVVAGQAGDGPAAQVRGAYGGACQPPAGMLMPLEYMNVTPLRSITIRGTAAPSESLRVWRRGLPVWSISSRKVRTLMPSGRACVRRERAAVCPLVAQPEWASVVRRYPAK